MSLGAQSQAWEVTLQAYSGQIESVSQAKHWQNRSVCRLAFAFYFCQSKTKNEEGVACCISRWWSLVFRFRLLCKGHLPPGEGLPKANEKEVTPG